jgi:CheY-like chemotaxis protein
MASPKCAAVLVAEDETDIREAIVAFLEDQGFEVYQAADGQEALETLQRTAHPTLILADLMMPVMDGAALVAALRRDDRLATLPVVILTAAERVPGAEGHRILRKPIELDELARIVGEFCSKRT